MQKSSYFSYFSKINSFFKIIKSHWHRSVHSSFLYVYIFLYIECKKVHKFVDGIKYKMKNVHKIMDEIQFLTFCIVRKRGETVWKNRKKQNS